MRALHYCTLSARMRLHGCAEKTLPFEGDYPAQQGEGEVAGDSSFPHLVRGAVGSGREVVCHHRVQAPRMYFSPGHLLPPILPRDCGLSRSSKRRAARLGATAAAAVIKKALPPRRLSRRCDASSFCTCALPEGQRLGHWAQAARVCSTPPCTLPVGRR